MDEKKITELLKASAYIRTGGSAEEKHCAEFFAAECQKFGCSAVIEPFEVEMAEIQTAILKIDGIEIPCKGYLCAGSETAEASLYYLTDSAPCSLADCRGKIVLMDGYLSFWRYQDLLEHGAVGFITYNGDLRCADTDIDQRELRTYVSRGKTIPGVNIHVTDAVRLVRDRAKTAKIVLKQQQYKGISQNVVLDLPGEIPQYIVCSAHYDSTPLSQGVYDNLSGAVGILALAQYFSKARHRYGLRFVWCGSEERGLLGSKAYCAAHKDTLNDAVVCINLDMIGCIMGNFEVCCTAEEKLVHYVEYLAGEVGFGCTVTQNVYPSDSTPFADAGVPAMTFARSAPGNTATIHNRYDTMAVMQPEQMVRDIAFIQVFAERMANACFCPITRKIPQNMKDKLDEYMARKRPE